MKMLLTLTDESTDLSKETKFTQIGRGIRGLKAILRMREFRSGCLMSSCRSRRDLSNDTTMIEIGLDIRELEQFKDFEFL